MKSRIVNESKTNCSPGVNGGIIGGGEGGGGEGAGNTTVLVVGSLTDSTETPSSFDSPVASLV